MRTLVTLATVIAMLLVSAAPALAAPPSRGCHTQSCVVVALGDSSVEAQPVGWSAGTTAAFAYTAAAAAAVNRLTFYDNCARSCAGVLNLGLYTDDPSTHTPSTLMFACSVSVKSKQPAWYSCATPAQVQVLAGATYWLAFQNPAIEVVSMSQMDPSGSCAGENDLTYTGSSLPPTWTHIGCTSFGGSTGSPLSASFYADHT